MGGVWTIKPGIYDDFTHMKILRFGGQGLHSSRSAFGGCLPGAASSQAARGLRSLERQVSGEICCFLGEICPKIYSEWSLSSIANPWQVWFLHFQRKPVTRSTWCSLGTRQTCFPAVCKSFAAIVTVLLSPRKARRCWRISGSMKWRALWRACLETQTGCKAGG